MSGRSEDQASGLRRLRARTPLRSIAFAGGPAAGCAALVAGIASELAARRHRVLVLDAGDDPAACARALSMAPGPDLLDIGMPSAQVVGSGVRLELIRAHRLAAQAVERPQRPQAVAALLEACEPPFTHALICLPVADEAQALAWLNAATDRVFVLSPAPPALRQAYALIKHLPPRAAAANLHVAVSGTRDATEARQVFENLARTAQRFLSAAPDTLGALPRDAAEAESRRALAAMVDRIESWPAGGGTGLATLLAKAAHAAAGVTG